MDSGYTQAVSEKKAEIAKKMPQGLTMHGKPMSKGGKGMVTKMIGEASFTKDGERMHGGPGKSGKGMKADMTGSKKDFSSNYKMNAK